jgi:hypothetical protein
MRVLLDEQSQPPLRVVIGTLLGSATVADIAVMRVRLAALDLGRDELSRVQRCRILIGQLDAHSLSVGGAVTTDPAARVAALLRFLRSGAVEIRSAGMNGWTPDFSIYRGIETGSGANAVCLVGAHYFHEPPERGPSFTWALDEAAAIQRITRRFEEMWERSHDVLTAVIQTIEQYAQAAA